MAQVDWQTEQTALIAAAQSAAAGTDKTLAEALAVELLLWGTPYDAGYTIDVDNAKSAITASRDAALVTWSTDTEACHNDTVAAIVSAETKAGLTVVSTIVWSADKLQAQLNLATLNSKLARMIRNNGFVSPLLEAEVDVLGAFRTEINRVYSARPLGNEGSNDFTTILILVPGVGQKTIEQADDFLTLKVAEGAALRDLASI